MLLKTSLLFCSGFTTITSSTINMQVYPNPNNGEFVVALNSKYNTQAALQVFNSLGSLVQQKELKLNGEHKESINLKHLNKGVYYVRLQSDNELLVGKVVVQ